MTDQPATGPSTDEQQPPPPPRPQPPAMTALEVARAPEPCDRIMCPDGAPRCLWAGPTGGPYPEGDDPAELVWQAAGCRDEPRTCPCATARTQHQELVAQLAAAPLAAQAMPVHPMRGGVPQRGPTAARRAPGAVPALQILTGPVDLDPAAPADPPVWTDRPVTATSGVQALATLAAAFTAERLDAPTLRPLPAEDDT